MISARPLVAHLRARLGADETAINVCASETVELAPAGHFESSAAVFLPDEELRATASVPTSTLEHEIRNAGRHIAFHGATVALRLDDALIADGCVYAGKHIERLRPQKRRPVIVANGQHLDEAQICTDMGSELFFGHWLVDALSKELLAEVRGLPGVSLSGREWLHERSYRDLLDLPSRRVSLARVRRLWVVDDRGYNMHRVARLTQLRSRLRQAVVPGPSRRVFIDRGTSGASRTLLNRDETVERLAAIGFTILEPERESAKDIATALAGATLVVGLEGSHLNHALIALPVGAALLAIQPAAHFNMFNKTVSEFAGLHFGFVVAEERAGGFHVDHDRLLRTIDLMEQVVMRTFPSPQEPRP